RVKLNEFDGGPVRVRINSGGGDVYEGIAILNTLRAYSGDITVVIESLAASAASFIAVGTGGRVVIRPNAEVMIHKAWAMLSGNADDIDKMRADLARQDVKLAKIYADRAGGAPDDWLSVMAAETWYTADEALAAGLVDEIEDAKQPAMASLGAMRAQFKFANRAAAPPPPVTRSESGDTTTTPSDGQKGDTVSILNQLAQELGKKPEDVKNALSGFFNETVEVSGQVDVTYPEETALAPTERVTVEPTVTNTDGEAVGSLGLAFAVTNTPDGWDITVDESTGAVTAKAPAGVEPGDTATATVVVNESTEVPVAFKVRALADDDEQPTNTEAVDTPASGESANIVTLDRDTYNLLVSQAKQGAQAASDKAREARIAEVDNWISEGRVAAAQRDKVLSVMHENEALAREVYGSNPKNTVPMAEVGHVGAGMPKSKAEELLAKADSIRNNKKGS
uniref:head maturation protease, ClpP-related n=1 Tax=Corynebacterium kefirresidentii TaxID=1979527 RepID=UPI0037350878